MKYIPKGSGQIIHKPDYSKRIMFKQSDFREKGHLLQVVINPRHKTLGDHFHKKQTEVCYILKGHATWIVNGKQYKVKPGDAFIISPHDIHSVQNETNTDCDVLVFKLNLPETDADFYPVS